MRKTPSHSFNDIPLSLLPVYTPLAPKNLSLNGKNKQSFQRMIIFSIMVDNKKWGVEMITLVEWLYQQITKHPTYASVYQLIQEKILMDDKALFKDVYNKSYNGKDIKEAFMTIRRRKWRAKKREWFQNAVAGFEHYRNTGEIKRGTYRHLVDDYLFLKEIEDKDPTYFQQTIKFPDVETAIQDRIDMLEKWSDSDDSYLVQYLYLADLSNLSKFNSIKIDIAVLQGKWLLEHEDLLPQTILKNGELWVEDDENDALDGEMVISQAPYHAVEYPMFGISDRRKHPVKHKEAVKTGESTLVPIGKHRKFEMSDDFQLYIDNQVAKIQDSQIKPLDMKDWLIFVEIINHRDMNFQHNRWIKVYLSDILETVYKNHGGWAYKDLVDRLIRMWSFKTAQKVGQNKIEFRHLISNMDFNTDLNGRYVVVYIGEPILSDIIKEEMINIYGKEMDELKLINPLSHHLSFVIQKIRMLYHSNQEEEKEIQFYLTWDDLSVSLIMNKPTKKENLDDIEKALADIKQKQFLVKDFKRFGSGFKVVCYPLKEYELQDMRQVKLSFNNGSKHLLSTTNP